MTTYYTSNDSSTANDASFYKNKVGPATLQVAVSVQLIVYVNIKITKKYCHILLYEFAAKQQEKEYKLRAKNFCKN